MREFIVRCENNKFTLKGETVHCKDCMHRNWETKGCKRNPSVVGWLDDDFCNYGKKQITGKLNNPDDSLLTKNLEVCKEQKSKLDCISRQQAIEAVVNEWKGGFPQTNFLRTQGFHDWLKRILDNLPPVTPTVSEDCISRKDAIEALLDHVNIPTQAQREYAVEIFENIPPIEPPKKVVAQIKVDTDELMERIKEEYEIKDRPVCEDAISREWIKNALLKYGFIAPDMTVTELIENAPSVIPERPKGEWIFKPKDAIDSMFAKPKCNKCGFESADGGNYCSNCGADMRGDKE